MLERAIRNLKKDFEKNVSGELRLRRSALSRTERRKIKDRLAVERARRTTKKQEKRREYRERLFHRQ
jgi:ribosomal protein S21